MTEEITSVEVERVRKALNDGWKSFPEFLKWWGLKDEEGEHK